MAAHLRSFMFLVQFLMQRLAVAIFAIAAIALVLVLVETTDRKDPLPSTPA